MNLKLVTYDGDLAQFIVNDEKNDEADVIQQAIDANFLYGKYDDEMKEDMKDASLYKIDDVDMAFLASILTREDIVDLINGVIVLCD